MAEKKVELNTTSTQTEKQPNYQSDYCSYTCTNSMFNPTVTKKRPYTIYPDWKSETLSQPYRRQPWVWEDANTPLGAGVANWMPLTGVAEKPPYHPYSPQKR
ncbi:uncharacterized protein LOC141913164 [Tubulanus polymorphus]|uniref:uncharacterized protein LOC141913164 n=1 Tax=Tubulanus polymorphus TaxID=672921 RepID=UPI003DA6B522